MGVLQWDHLVTTLLPPRLFYSWKYVSARNCVLFEKLTRVLTGSVKEQGQILISLSIDRAGLFFFFRSKICVKVGICLIIQVSWHLWSVGKPSLCIDQKEKNPSNLIKLCCVWQPLLLHRELFYRSWRKIDFQVCPLSLLPYDRNICLCCDKLLR